MVSTDTWEPAKEGEITEVPSVNQILSTVQTNDLISLKEYFDSKGINNIRVLLSDELPQTDKVSGKFKHIYADCTDHE